VALLAGGDREALLVALVALDERDQAVIACRYLLDLSERETADVLGCRPGTVKSRLSRALERMRAQLELRPAEEAVAP
jgi:RNA polymerase sigma factor (sigma-70 family)